MTLKELAEAIGATLVGDGTLEVKGVKGIEDAKEGDVTYIKDQKLLRSVELKASALIVPHEVEGLQIPQLVVENPLYGFARALEVFYGKPYKPKGIMQGAFVASSADVHPEATVYPNVYIDENVRIGARTVVYPGVYIGEETKIGEDCIIYPNVTIRERVRIGSRVIIHSGTVIGSDGYGYVQHEGKHYKIPQVGTVRIEDDVEIGASVTIDRATTGETVIGQGTKIDNLVQIAHNVKIGRHCIIVAQVGIAGSSRLGDYVTLAGQVGVADHVEIADGTIVAAQSGVMSNLERGTYMGTPVMPHMQFFKVQALLRRLPEIYKKVTEIEKKLQGGQDD
ncbi:MAG: UDP-3-O-(3-hydroxymyristoyl)glucosamine N-acyltransferase [Nitrospirae bacterium]|nr:MAG: UDP-3-O-(3-hydroxymyristoyl)glucosamine N-acyltransferase [Nitrospirota bacterium]